MEVQVNYVAVLFAVVASMVVGFAWYSPVLFGKQWMKLMGLTKENMESAKKGDGENVWDKFCHYNCNCIRFNSCNGDVGKLFPLPPPTNRFDIRILDVAWVCDAGSSNRRFVWRKKVESFCN
jgi:hypothetical protein